MPVNPYESPTHSGVEESSCPFGKRAKVFCGAGREDWEGWGDQRAGAEAEAEQLLSSVSR